MSSQPPSEPKEQAQERALKRAPKRAQEANEPVRSGSKFKADNGAIAIKDGIKAGSSNASLPNNDAAQGRKPPWLRVKLGGGARYQSVRQTVHEHRLATVCEESHCPNIGECWNNGTATIMLMGSVCTRACRFCSVDTGNPNGWLDAKEPEHAAESVRLMNLKYVVLTSVDRDDLADGGAAHYAACVRAIKRRNPQTAVEALTPDFSGCEADVATVVDSGLEVFAQNLETVKRLTHRVRDPRAGYAQTLSVLRFAKQHRPTVLTKSSLMVGIGESDDEIRQAMQSLRDHHVDLLTLGQYLRPTANHLPVDRWVHPDQFDAYRQWGLEMGFREVASGPLVRSSYRADRIFDNNNLGLAGHPANPPQFRTNPNGIPIKQL
ncbi:MAG: lipoyl synthase [Pseudomonadales bacterium]